MNTPTAPVGMFKIRACWLVYPKVVRRIEEKLERPPADRSVLVDYKGGIHTIRNRRKHDR